MKDHISANGKIGFDLFLESNDELRLIFLDLSMPVMNGFEFLEALNAYLQAENKEFVNVVISTSNDNDSEKKRAKSLYPNISFYPKPLSKEMFIEIVDGIENV
jgi:CheY-like chemotaxis protein